MNDKYQITKLQNDLNEAIGRNLPALKYCTVYEGTDYKNSSVIVNQDLQNIIQYIKSRGFDYWINIGSRNYGTIDNNYGTFWISLRENGIDEYLSCPEKYDDRVKNEYNDFLKQQQISREHYAKILPPGYNSMI